MSLVEKGQKEEGGRRGKDRGVLALPKCQGQLPQAQRVVIAAQPHHFPTNATPKMASAEQPERQLSDLNDLEIAEMTRALKDSEASSRPLVGALEPIASLADEYEGAPTFLAKIAGLGQDGWTGVRRLRGDGDCFYRGQWRTS